MADIYFVDVTTGNNGDSGLTEALAWKDLGFAANQVAADDKVWVKASASYIADDPDTATTNWEITTAGGNVTPIIWEGYYSSTGDGGVVTVDAQDTNLTCLLTSIGGNVYNVFKNFRFTQAADAGVSLNAGADDHAVFKNCRFDNNADDGIDGDNLVAFEGCLFDNNGAFGCDVDTLCTAICCIAHSNTGRGIDLSGARLGCISYSNGTAGREFAMNSGSFQNDVCINCIADGDDGATTIGFFGDPTNSDMYAIVNCIAMDCNEGIRFDGGGTELCIARNNLFYSNTTDRTNWLIGEGDVDGTEDPFRDSGSRDYSLKHGSEAHQTGLDARSTISFWNSFAAGTNPPNAVKSYGDIGALQSRSPGVYDNDESSYMDIGAFQSNKYPIYAGIIKNAPLDAFPFAMYETASPQDPKAGEVVVVQASKDGGAFANVDNTPATEVSDGAYEIDLTANDLNANTIMLKMTSNNAITRFSTIVTAE